MTENPTLALTGARAATDEHADNLQLSVNRLIELGTQWRMERDEARAERDELIRWRNTYRRNCLRQAVEISTLREERDAAVAERDLTIKRQEYAFEHQRQAYETAFKNVREARAAVAAALAFLRNPTSDMLNRAADDMIRDIDPLQQRARYLLDAVADEVERALASVTSHPLDEDRQRAAGGNPDRQRNQGYTTRPGGSDTDDS